MYVIVSQQTGSCSACQLKYPFVAPQPAAKSQVLCWSPCLLLYSVPACCPFADLKCQIANESSTSNDLMLELEQAQHDGPAAQQLARLKQELSHREEELINQQCR